MRRRLNGAIGAVFALTLCAGPALAAPADGRTLVVISPIRIDSAISGKISNLFSQDALRRELSIALESTGLFRVQNNNAEEGKLFLDELARTGKRPTKNVFRDAKYVLIPVLEGFSVAERRRPTPGMKSKDSVSVGGIVDMTIEIRELPNGESKPAQPIVLRYQSPETLADPLANDPLAGGRQTASMPATPEEAKVVDREVGRLFAISVSNTVYPTRVADVADGTIYLTRGENAGFSIGQSLRIMRLGREIRDPVTHEVLDRRDEQIGIATVKEVRPKVTIAAVTSSTQPIAVGDIVREMVDSGPGR